MATTVKLKVEGQDLLTSLRRFFRSILEIEDISAILVPQQIPGQNIVMPTLVSDPDRLEGVDPIAPYFPLNAARIVARLTRKPMGGKLAAVLRPCEIRAFIELVKLNQGRTEDLVLIGLDCLGAYSNRDFAKFVGEDLAESTIRFLKNSISGSNALPEGPDLTPACKACEHPIPGNADIHIGVLGADTDNYLSIQSRTSAGDDIISRLELPEIAEPAARKEAVDNLMKRRRAYRDTMFEETRGIIDDLDKLNSYLAGCVNCYNCRVACPVCYCKECVFVTDVFNHDPSQYLQWSTRKGAIKMPTDTIFYHLTRLAHMSTACVGCGQCSNACPNDIPVMELFRSVADRTQKAFEYEAGRSVDESPPLSVFMEEEFADVVGIE